MAESEPVLPAYCFQTSDIYPEPSWCSPTNQKYIQQCNEVNTIEDKYELKLYDLTQGKGSDLVVVAVDFKQNHIIYHREDTAQPISILRANTRYAYIMTPPGGDPGTYQLMISYWETDYNGPIKNLVLTSDIMEDGIKLMNCVRKLIYSTKLDSMRLLGFYPYVLDYIKVYKTVDVTSVMTDITADQYSPMFITVDEEAILMYDGVSASPSGVLYFSKEISDNAVERIYAHTVSKIVEIETNNMKFLFKSPTEDSPVFRRFCFYVQGRIHPKLKSIFNFTDTDAEFCEFMTSHPMEPYSEEKPEFVPSKAPTFKQKRRESPSPDFNEPSSFPSVIEGASGSSDMDRIADANQTEMESLVIRLQSTNENIAGISEDAQLIWITMEAEIEQKISEGLVPESAIESGGLDPNSSAHFIKCIDEIQEALFTEKIDHAISYMQGCKQIFTNSKCSSVVHWFQAYSDVDKLRQIYLAGSKS